MAATGFTPVYIYASGTTGNIPSASNLTNTTNGSEIALNYFDGKLFYKNSSNSVVTVPLLQSSGSQNGWLSSTDWTTFNNKSPAAGSSSITTVGTITSGTWNGSTIDIAHGGTNATSFNAPASSINGLVWFDGTRLVNDATTSDVGYNSSTNTFYANNVNYGGTLTGSTGVLNIGSGQIYKDASGNTSVGYAGQILYSKFLVYGDETLNNHLVIASSRAYSTSPATKIQFDGQYNSGGTYLQFAQIQGGKENATDGNTAGYLSFATFQQGGSLAERMRISSNGGVSIGNTTDPGAGNLRFTTAGSNGIYFGSGTRLDTYETGTYTPAFSADTDPTVTYTTQSGKYTKIGNTIHFSAVIQWSAKSGGTGNLFVTIPVAASGSQGTFEVGLASGISATTLNGAIDNGYSKFYFRDASNNNGGVNVSSLGSSGTVICGGTYFI